MPQPSRRCAHEILDTVPLVMRAIRAEMRAHRHPANLSVPQFRTLVFLDRHPAGTLGAVAEHIGLTPPSMSRLVDGLVRRRLVERRGAVADRRRLELTLTARGRSALEATRANTQARLEERLAALTVEQQTSVTRAMQILRPVFRDEDGGRTAGARR
jgi:DNA-binding MarR family transcriptional regulator